MDNRSYRIIYKFLGYPNVDKKNARGKKLSSMVVLTITTYSQDFQDFSS